MEKEKILQILQDNNIDFLKLGEVKFIKSENLLCLTFLYDEINQDLINVNKSQIKNLAKNYVGIENLKYNIKFVKAFLDEERLKNVILAYLKTYHHFFYTSVKNVKVIREDKNFSILIEMTISEEKKEFLNREILNYLNSKYFYNFHLDVKPFQDKTNLLDEHKNEILDNLTEPTLLNKMKVNKIENIIGEILENSCYPYEFYKNSEENVYLCGNLLSIEEIQFTKKDGETKGIRYALKVKCLDKVFNASLFPTKKTLDIIKTIESGIDVIMSGSLDSFGNGLSLKIKSLAKCKIQDYELPKKELNKEFANYKLIMPQKYEEISQINLFEQKRDIDYLLNNEFVVFDLETTGLDFTTHKVTEIGAVKIKNGVIVETFSTFINPEQDISAEITKLTSITNEMVKDAPLLEDVMPDFYKFCKNSILVGQNIQFDFGFIDYYSRKYNYVFNHEKEDTITIAKKHIFLKNYKLKTIAEALNVPLINAHRAINDALCTAKVFIKLIEKYY